MGDGGYIGWAPLPPTWYWGAGGVAVSRLRLNDAPGRAVTASYQSGAIREQLTGLSWPVQDNHIVVLELHE